MITTQKMPKHLRQSKIFSSMVDIINYELQSYEDVKKDIEDQLSPLTATWSLEKWESIYGIKTNPFLDIELRRAKILSKLLGGETITVAKMKEILSPFSKEIEIEQIEGEYRFNIKFITEHDDKNVVDTIYSVINDIKPAHLGFFIGFADSIKIKITSSFRIQHGDSLQTGDHYANTELRVK